VSVSLTDIFIYGTTQKVRACQINVIGEAQAAIKEKGFIDRRLRFRSLNIRERRGILRR